MLNVLTALPVFALTFSSGVVHAAAAEGCNADETCRALAADGSDADDGAISALQVALRAAAARTDANQSISGDEYDGVNRLSFTHVPCNFGHTVEKVGLGSDAHLFFLGASLLAPLPPRKLWIMEHMVKGHKGELWGMMHPASRGISAVTGCNLYYTPGKYWSAEGAAEYFSDREIFAIIRDPYDKMANEFRMQVQGIESGYTGLTRPMVSFREGNLEREGPEYQTWYKTCDVNAYLQAELKKYLAGDRFRDNCHLLPQSEYLEKPFGATKLVDNRKLVASFNSLMEERGYPMRMGTTVHNWLCTNVSAYSLTEETKELIRQVYKSDFDLVCEKFGYCDDKELTCLSDIPGMCGGKPALTQDTPPTGIYNEGN